MHQLQPFAALGVAGVDAAGCALVMDHPGQRGAANLPMACTHRKGQVCVFEVGGSEFSAEAADGLPELQWDGEAGGAHVVHLAGITHARVVGVATAAVIPGLAVVPHQSARFL